MPKSIYYAMDPGSLKSYIDHKNNMQEASTLLTAEKIESIRTAVKDFRSSDAPKNYSVEGGTAKIAIVGPLEPKADLCAVLFDIEMTTYSDIINSINLAENDDAVENIVFEINSPGGNVVGLNRTAEKIKNASKPTVAYVTDMAASAAYWLASQADTIMAEHKAVEIGSIGVFSQYVDATEADKARGIERVSFRSANAPLKNANPSTIEGANQIVKRITEIESVFFDYISSGRQTSVEDIKENYGKGAILIAGEALRVGMIDAIEAIESMDTPIQTSNINNENKTEEDSMSEKIEMTQEQLDSVVSKAATSAVEETLSKQASEKESTLAKEKKESERKAGFSSLLAGFPKQKEMINAEIEKGNFASADFAMSVSAAEGTRVKVAEEAATNEAESAPDLATTVETTEKTKLNAVANMCIKGRA